VSAGAVPALGAGATQALATSANSNNPTITNSFDGFFIRFSFKKVSG